jgi:hypothetical protein
VSVRCNGEIHKIRYEPGGRLTLLSHSKADLRRWRNYVEIGGEPCECLKMVKNWGECVGLRGPTVSDLPQVLQGHAQRAIDRKVARWEARYPEGTALEGSSGRECPGWLADLLTSQLSGDLWRTPGYRCVVLNSQDWYPDYRFSLVANGKVQATCRLSCHWWEEIESRGCAYVDGLLVLHSSRPLCVVQSEVDVQLTCLRVEDGPDLLPRVKAETLHKVICPDGELRDG